MAIFLLLAALCLIGRLHINDNERAQKIEELATSIQELRGEIQQMATQQVEIQQMVAQTQQIAKTASSPESSAVEPNGLKVSDELNEAEPAPQKIGLRNPHLPSACGERSLQGAMQFVCRSAESEPWVEFWREGSKLLGEGELISFLSRCKSERGKLAGAHVWIWSDTRDVHGFKGAMSEQVKDVYGLANLASKAWGPETWVLDVGGNLGITAIHLHLRAPNASLLTLEPSPWNYLLLRLNLLQNVRADSKVFALQGGLSTVSGVFHGTHMFTNAWASRNDEIFQPGKSIKGDLREQELGEFTSPLRTLEELGQMYGIKHVKLMKLDCEGCEWMVGIQMMETGAWKMVDMLFGELHALCQNEVSDAAQCLPRNVSIQQAAALWYFLCETRKFHLEWGCVEPRFAALGNDVAAALAGRICGSKSIMVKPLQCAMAKKLCKDQSRSPPQCYPPKN